MLPTHLPPPSCMRAQSCNPMNCSPPGSSVHGILQARILEWVAILFSMHFFLLGMVLITASCIMSQTSVHSSSGTLSDLIPWIHLSLPLYNHKGFDLGHSWMAQWFFPTFSNFSQFPYFLQFIFQIQSEFSNKEFMIWATVSSQPCFCWLYRTSPSSAAKNIINLILVLTIWWCLCVESSLVLLEEGVCYDQWVLLAKLC